MTLARYNQAKAVTINANGAEVKLPSGSKWLVSETDRETQVTLDKPGHALDGLTICMDWSQGFVRPGAKIDRVNAIIQDADILEMHAADYLESAATK
jgi:hypothetical protein